jgi:TonB-dependent receptor-like protein
MICCFVRRLPAVFGCGVTILVLAVAGPLAAQDINSAADSSEISTQPLTTEFSIAGEVIDALPLDRPAEALLLQPGVTANNRGELLLRGGRPGDAALYLDGVPVLSAFRGTPFFALNLSQTLQSHLDLAPNAVRSIAVTTGPLPAAVGNGQGGVIDLTTLESGSRLAASLSYETDEPFGAAHSFGLNRAEGGVSGGIGPSLTFSVAGLLQGQRSLGSGFGAEDAPIFVSAGVDTTVAVASSPGDPFSDTTNVPVYDFAVSRGRCEDFAQSADPGIASNYELDCRGTRTPASTISNYDVMGKLAYSYGGGGRLSLVALASQEQNRNFDYGSLYNTVGLTGNRSSSSALILSVAQPIARGARPLRLDAHLSLQRDRVRSGPLTPEPGGGTAEPFGGFMIAPLDLRFDFDNFPVDDELIRNYRTNEIGSRRSPYDLENAAQYGLVDQYRNNAYGLYNLDPIARVVFPESGGPLGLLALYRENRTVASGAFTWEQSASNQIQIGGEFTKYSIANYSHLLDSQAFSDVYIEHPIRGAIFVQDQVRLGEASITAGVRYDFFDSRARRWADFPRISTHPLYNPANPEAFFADNTLFPKDKSHSYTSPHVQAAYRLSERTALRAGFATQGQVPDFRDILLRNNSDISVSGGNVVFGSDLDFEHASIFEFGAHYLLSDGLSVDLSLYGRNVESQVITTIVARFDPLRGNNQNIPILTNDGAEKVRGVDIKVERQWGRSLAGSLVYSYQDAKLEPRAGALQPGDKPPAPDSRPHSFAAAVALKVPGEWKQGTLAGTVLRNVGLFTTLRVASGTPYTACLGDVSVVSPDLCSPILAGINGSRLPTFKQLDLRLTKSFGPGGRFTGYLDARNVLNFRNVLAVFSGTGTTESPLEAAANWRADSADLANEAFESGAYQVDGSINLGAGQSNPRANCAGWVDQGGSPAAPNCIYLIRAEERFGNGDHTFDLTEQKRASDALYRVVRGPQELTGPPRRVRLGVEVSF